MRPKHELARAVPSLASILSSDYASLLCAMAPPLVVALAVAEALDVLPRRGNNARANPFLVYLAPVVVAVCVPILAQRVRSIRTLFANGLEVEGEVLEVGFYRDRGSVTFSYEHAGRRHEVSCALHKSSRAARLARGQRVTVLVDPTNPGRAVIAELYS